jgi:hypothetical protein
MQQAEQIECDKAEDLYKLGGNVKANESSRTGCLRNSQNQQETREVYLLLAVKRAAYVTYRQWEIEGEAGSVCVCVCMWFVTSKYRGLCHGR